MTILAIIFGLALIAALVVHQFRDFCRDAEEGL